MPGVLIQNEQSDYADELGSHYQFPNRYLNVAREIVGQWIVYYESGSNGGRRVYYGCAVLQGIAPDHSRSGHHLGYIEPESYIPFPEPVPFKRDGRYMNSSLLKDDGTLSMRNRDAMRIMPQQDFQRILIHAGLGELVTIAGKEPVLDTLSEQPRLDFAFPGSIPPTPEITQHPVVSVVTKKRFRSADFRRKILQAYGRRCAFTGLGFVNGGGNPEVQAAHILPVEEDGPHVVNNGIALSATVHWMFDKGLLSLSDTHDILVSRFINDRDSIARLLHSDGKARMPEAVSDHPDPTFLEWHRTKRFER